MKVEMLTLQGQEHDQQGKEAGKATGQGRGNSNMSAHKMLQKGR